MWWDQSQRDWIPICNWLVLNGKNICFDIKVLQKNFSHSPLGRHIFYVLFNYGSIRLKVRQAFNSCWISYIDMVHYRLYKDTINFSWPHRKVNHLNKVGITQSMVEQVQVTVKLSAVKILCSSLGWSLPLGKCCRSWPF